MKATDSQLIELGNRFDDLVTAEARVPTEEDIPVTLSDAISEVTDCIQELPAASPSAKAVKVRVITYWMENGPDRVAAVAASLLRDLQ